MKTKDDFLQNFQRSLETELTRCSSRVIHALTHIAGTDEMYSRDVSNIVLAHFKRVFIKLPVLFFIDSLCRSNLNFSNLFLPHIPELFCETWENSKDEIIRPQLIKLYISWRMFFPRAVIEEIDKRMTQKVDIQIEAKSAKEEPHYIKQEVEENNNKLHNLKGEIESKVAVVAVSNPEEMEIDIEESNESSLSSGIDTIMADILFGELLDLLINHAEKKKSESTSFKYNISTKPSFIIPFDIDSLKEFKYEVYESLQRSTEESKAKFLDWRFQLRSARRKNNFRTRSWYPDSDTWAELSDPADLSPLDLIQKLSKPRKWNLSDHMVRVGDGKDSESFCAISGDKLEKVYNEEAEDWFYKDCRRLTKEEADKYSLPEGAICIVDCIKSLEENLNQKNIFKNFAMETNADYMDACGFDTEIKEESFQ